MKPVDIYPYTYKQTKIASALTPYGAVVVKTAAGKAAAVKAATETGILGVVVNDAVEHTPYGGFYNAGESMSIIPFGPCRVWVVPNGADIDIEAGDYLEVADLGSGSQTGRHGILEEAGNAAGGTRTATSVARALEDVTMGNESYKVPASNVAVGDTTITMTAGDITTMGLTRGDYILMEDLNGNLMVNKVQKLTPTLIYLEIPSTVALTVADGDLVTKMHQVEAVLL